MKDEAIIPRNWDDIVFQNRNKDYGAYLNRKKYPIHIALATFIALIIIGFVLTYPRIRDYFKPEEEVIPLSELKQVVVNLGQPPPILPNEPPPATLDVAPPPVKAILKFLPPKVTSKQVIEEEIPTVEEIKQYQPRQETTTGTGTEVVVFQEPVKEVVRNEEAEKEEPNKVFLVVEQPPEYEGGLREMFKFIQSNMRYPAMAGRLRIEGSVYVSFVVDKDGQIKDATVVKGIGSGCDEEAIRVIQMMPPWKPGKQRGKPVKVRFVLPLKFQLLD